MVVVKIIDDYSIIIMIMKALMINMTIRLE